MDDPRLARASPRRSTEGVACREGIDAGPGDPRVAPGPAAEPRRVSISGRSRKSMFSRPKASRAGSPGRSAQPGRPERGGSPEVGLEADAGIAGPALWPVLGPTPLGHAAVAQRPPRPDGQGRQLGYGPGPIPGYGHDYGGAAGQLPDGVGRQGVNGWAPGTNGIRRLFMPRMPSRSMDLSWTGD